MPSAFIIPFLIVLLGGISTPSFASNSPTIALDRPVLFLTPGGEDVLLDPGTYEVVATDTGLKLFPEGGNRTDAILLDATAGNHEETLVKPLAKYELAKSQEDVIYLALLLPDGSGYEAVGSYSGIRPRLSALAILQRRMPRRSPKKPSSRPTRLATPLKPVDCGPFIKSLGRKGHVDPALAVYQNKMHLVTRVSVPGNLRLHRTLWHSVYDKGRWSKPKLIKRHTSKTGVALATFGNKLHEVHLGRKSSQLYHSTYDGRKWSKSRKITGQYSKATPSLGAYKNRLYMVHQDTKTNDLWYTIYTPQRGWKARRKIPGFNRIGLLQSKMNPGGFFTDDPIRLRLLIQNAKFNDFQIYKFVLRPNGDIERVTKSLNSRDEPNINSFTTLSLSLNNINLRSSDFVMFLDHSRSLHWLHSPESLEKSRRFLSEKSQSRPALAQSQRCVHAVYVHHPSRKLRHVQFDVDGLK